MLVGKQKKQSIQVASFIVRNLEFSRKKSSIILGNVWKDPDQEHRQSVQICPSGHIEHPLQMDLQ